MHRGMCANIVWRDVQRFRCKPWRGVVIRSCRICFDEGNGQNATVMVYCGARRDGGGIWIRDGKGRIDEINGQI